MRTIQPRCCGRRPRTRRCEACPRRTETPQAHCSLQPECWTSCQRSLARAAPVARRERPPWRAGAEAGARAGRPARRRWVQPGLLQQGAWAPGRPPRGALLRPRAGNGLRGSAPLKLGRERVVQRASACSQAACRLRLHARQAAARRAAPAARRERPSWRAGAEYGTRAGRPAPSLGRSWLQLVSAKCGAWRRRAPSRLERVVRDRIRRRARGRTESWRRRSMRSFAAEGGWKTLRRTSCRSSVSCRSIEE